MTDLPTLTKAMATLQMNLSAFINGLSPPEGTPVDYAAMATECDVMAAALRVIAAASPAELAAAQG